MEEKISVIVPVYNIAGYVDKCISSLVAQTYENLEILLVDDGSTDESGRICDAWATKDARITVFHKENGGLSDARNYALDRMNGEWIGFVDGDDWVHPHMFALLLGAARANDAQMASCSYTRENPEEFRRMLLAEEIPVRTVSGLEALNDLRITNVMAWNKLYRRSLFENLRYPKGRCHEDEFLAHYLLDRCEKIAVVDCPLYFYENRGGSIMRTMSKERLGDVLAGYQDRITYTEKKRYETAHLNAVSLYCNYCLKTYYAVSQGTIQMDSAICDKLWRWEKEMADAYPHLALEEGLRKFAEGPEVYEKWQKRCDCLDALKNHCPVIRAKRALGRFLRARGLRK